MGMDPGPPYIGYYGNCLEFSPGYYPTGIDVTNLAGYCRAAGHHTLAFALMLDGPPNWTATVLEGRMIGAIAGY